MQNKESPKNNRHHGVAHHLAHRTRYRLSRKDRNNRTLKSIQDSLAKVPGVKAVEFNERTGSVLVHHDEKPEILGILATVLEELGIDLLEGVAGEEIIVVSGVSIVANLIKSRIGGANTLVSQMTNNYFDLKTLLPFLFLGAGIYQASRNRFWWEQIPAYALFYYAYDSYIKFHGTGLTYSHIQNPDNGHKETAS